MTLLRNLSLFFVLFLPASCATGLSGGWLTGPLPTPRIGYELGLFAVAVLPLLLPSLLAAPVLHFAARLLARRRSPREARLFATLAMPAALLGVHLLVFGPGLFSLPLVTLFVIPGLLYGWLLGIPGVRRPGGAGPLGAALDSGSPARRGP